MIRNTLARVALIPAGLVVAMSAAHAELPAAVSTAVTAAQTDGGTLVGILATAGAAVYLIAKLLKKFGVFF